MFKKEPEEKKKLPGWVIIPVLVVVIVLFFAISRLTAGSGKESKLETVTVEKGNVKQTYNASGIVESGKTKVFYSPVNAPILNCTAKVGTAVKAGDILVAFDVTNLERDNRQSQLNELAAKYSNEDAKEQSSRARSQAQTSEESLRSQIQEKEKQVTALQQQMNSSSGAAMQNASKLAALQQKVQDNLNSQSAQKARKENAERELESLDKEAADYAQKSQELMREAEDATNAISTLEQEYRTLEQQMSQVGNTDTSGISQELAAAVQELEALKTGLSELQSGAGLSAAGLTSGQRKNMQVSENLAELASLSTEELLNKGKEGIKAEFDGIISDVKALEGSTATQGGELFTLVSNRDVYVGLEVSANDFDNLKIDSQAEVKIGDKTYRGKLASIDKIALPNEKGNPVIKARVQLNNPDENIYIGVNAKVSLSVAEKKNVLCVPGEVVNTSSDGDFVYIIRNGVVKKQAVELGVVSGSRVEIVSGLKEGDKVVSDVSDSIEEGMKATAAEG